MTDNPTADNEEVEDLAENEDSEATPAIYDISSYGAEYTVDTIRQRMERGRFVVPDFQRNFVWDRKKASRFIESLLLGLPVPSIFLYKDEGKGLHLIVDGQQRLITLMRFFKGFFGERKFRLYGVAEPWNGKTIDDLSESEREALEDAIIHTIVFKQESPPGSNNSIFHVFERLNSGGMILNPQEIRNSVNYGNFVELLKDCNNVESWRQIYGPKHKRMKDCELILRFFALFFKGDEYQKPMRDFLDKFMWEYRDIDDQYSRTMYDLFEESINYVVGGLGKSAFRPERALNAAVFDAVMVNVANIISAKKVLPQKDDFRSMYQAMLSDEDFQAAYTSATSDEENLKARLQVAKNYLTKGLNNELA